MKRLSIILMALALALAFTVPAMALHIGDAESPEGDLTFSGRFQFDGESRDVDGTTSDFFDDDFDFSMAFVKGDVKFFIGLEIADTNPYEGDSHKDTPVDNYYVEWNPYDNFKLKIGEYGCDFGYLISTDGACRRNIQATYMVDGISISGILAKRDDYSDGGPAGTEPEDELDEIVLLADFEELGPVNLSLGYFSVSDDDPAGAEFTFTGVHAGFDAGPVGISLEYGANGGDNDGNYIMGMVGLGDLVGFDLNLNYYTSSDDYLVAYEGNDFAPMLIFGDQINEELLDVTALWVDAGYDVQDNLSLWAAFLVSAENDAGDEYGTEIDVGLAWDLRDNVVYKAAYGTYSEGDGVATPDDPDVDTTEIWWRLQFTF
jgi:hypothetical protein